MPKYRAKQTTIVEAVKYEASRAWKSHPQWLIDAITKGYIRRTDSGGFEITTMHGQSEVKRGDDIYIVREPDGEHVYPCDARVFEVRYEEIT